MYTLKLKENRQKAGFKTQKDAAAFLGIKERKYASWEREEVALTLKDACMLAKAFDCTPNDLCGWPKGKNQCAELEDAFEQELIDCYRVSTTPRKTGILQVARDSAAMSKETAECAPSEPGKREAV